MPASAEVRQMEHFRGDEERMFLDSDFWPKKTWKMPRGRAGCFDEEDDGQDVLMKRVIIWQDSSRQMRQAMEKVDLQNSHKT